jgi:hypothetical protein
MTRRRCVVLVAAVMTAAAAVAGIATAGSAVQRQRVAIVFHSLAKRFVLTPLTSGPIRRDSGPYTSCCWTRRFFTRDGESMELDNPTITMRGKRGTITWRERITFVNLDHAYDIATATWTISHGTGAYAHLEGHGREAAVDKKNVEVAAKAEGLVGLKREAASP